MDDLLVTISKRRLEELEELEHRLPLLLEEARAAFKADRLRQLREKDKADVRLVRARVRRYADKHRDTINARRRENRGTNTVILNTETVSSCGVKSPEEDSERSGPRPKDGNPEEGNVGPAASCPIVLHSAGDKEADAAQPKHKARPKKIHK